MKKPLVLLIFLVIGISACSIAFIMERDRVPSTFKEVSGEIRQVQFNEQGDIVIPKEEIGSDVTYYSYPYGKIVIGLLAVRDSNHQAKVVINNCSSCERSAYNYFVQVGRTLYCEANGKTIEIDALENKEQEEVGPILIDNIKEEEGNLVISHQELEKYEELFRHWKGPKD